MKTLISRLITVGLCFWIAVEAQGALVGGASYQTLRSRNAEAEALRAEVAALTARREDLARRADALNRRSLDLEYLKERARVVLGFVAEDEIVIPRDQFDAAIQKTEKWAR
ncbi:MAG: septum formation initiator family protein [Pseudomonadota bacterium]